MSHFMDMRSWLALGVVIFFINSVGLCQKKDSLLQVLEEAGDTTRVNTLLDLAEAYMATQPDSAIYYGTLAYNESHPIYFTKGKGLAKLAIADGYYFLKNFPKSVEHLTDAAEIFNASPGSELLYAESLNKLGINYNRLTDYPMASRFSSQALEIFRKNGHLKGQWKCISNLGIISKEIGDLKKSLEYNLEALNITRELNDASGTTKALTNVGNTYFALDDHDKALEYYQEALDIADSLGILTSMALLKNNIATCYQSTNEPKEAEKYYLESLQIKKELNDYSGIAITLNNIGFNHLDQGEISNAEISFKTALAQPFITEITKSNSYNGLARVGLAKKDYKLAESNALKGYDLINELGNTGQLSTTTQTLYEVYKAVNNHERALHFLTLYNSYEDSLLNEENLKEIGRLEARYEFGLKEEQRTAEQLQAKLNNDVILEKQRLYTFLSLTGFFTMFVVTFIIYRSHQQKKHANHLLQEKNSEILLKNEKIETQSKKLSELHQVKDRLFMILSHDLRSPLETLKSLLDLSERGLVTDEEYKKFLPALSKNVGYTSELLNNLLHWTRSQMTGENITPEVFDLSTISNNIINLYKKQAANKKIEIINATKAPLEVFADKNMIEMVIRNLISNAIKFCKESDIIAISAKIQNGEVEVTVSDTGIGIQPENLDKIFHKSTFSTRGTDNEKGTGLGLMLCKQFVEKNGGEIRVESKPKKGSRFIFTVPVKTMLMMSKEPIKENPFTFRRERV